MAETRDAATMTRRLHLMASSISSRSNLLRKLTLQGKVYFQKILTPSSVYRNYKKGPSTLALPSWFIDDHGDKIRKSVILRSESCTTTWTVSLSIYFKSPTTTQVKFAGGWNAFTAFNGLLEGDAIVFSLTAMSEFEIYLFRKDAGLKLREQIPSRAPGRAPRKRQSDSKLASSKETLKRSRKTCKDEQFAADGNVDSTLARSKNNLIERIKTKRPVGDFRQQISVSASGHCDASLSSCLQLLDQENGRDSSPEVMAGLLHHGHGREPSIDHGYNLDMILGFDTRGNGENEPELFADISVDQDLVEQSSGLPNRQEAL